MTTITTDATLRPARVADLPAVERLLLDAGLPLDGVADAIGHFTVAEHDGALVGVAGVEPCGADALLRSVAVRPEWRARGLGRRLVERAIAGAECEGTRGLYLLTTTAERWFPRFGFAAVDRAAVPAAVAASLEFRSACPASAVAMARPCPPTTPPTP